MRDLTPYRWLAMFLASILAITGRAAEKIAHVPDCPPPNPTLLNSRWPARWIAPPGVSLTDYGVFLFRKRFTVARDAGKFVVHISADNRYRLFVNGEFVCNGPQRGDRMRWHYDSVDLRDFLHGGENTLAVQVWNFGEERPYALMSLQTGLIVQGDGPGEQVVNTGEGWRVFINRAFMPLPVSRERFRTFIVVGPGEQIDGTRHPWDWEMPEFDDSRWAAPRVMEPGMPRGYGTDAARWLVPRNLPRFCESTPGNGVLFGAIRRVVGATAPSPGFLSRQSPWTIPAKTSARLLLDQAALINGFPQLVVSNGRGAKVTLAYAEALVDANSRKGNRDEIDGREVRGVEDCFLPDGGAKRLFTTLDYRTWRYVEMRIETETEPLTVDAVYCIPTGYPFVENGEFRANDPELARVWEVGWRTARLCADETYMDCPYYERLQYVGDTRIQALVSLYVSGDDRLMRNAITLFEQSRIPEGLTQSRYPSHTPQVINTFSLFWIAMVHDYWMLRDDPTFLAAQLRGVQGVLDWFEERIDAKTGLLGPLPYWTFVDWSDEWARNRGLDIGGEPPGAHTGGSSIVTLQFAIALDQAAELHHAFGGTELAARCARLAANLRAAVMRTCWDDARKLLADTPDKREFSQHANALAILAGAVRDDAARELITKVIADKSLVQCTLYFRFYLLRALKAAGLGDQYLEQLGPWRDMLALGLTTFAERPEPTRSDCHAWSASPVYEFLATVCGVEPASPGFKSVRIEPHLGKLAHAEGVVPHPAGLIRVTIDRAGTDGMHATVELPGSLTGELVWAGRRVALRPGKQDVTF
ncbi:MAG: alpha-L-rhamnosidase [Opitutaceae bacterium]|nr:alpha-L-rhamnosidase [Opitutaceae bacterium]